MNKHSKNTWKDWKLWIIAIATIAIIAIGIFYLKNNKTEELNNIKIGDIITLKEEDRILLREKTISNLKGYLKAPSTATFQEEFIYNYNEPNIIQVKGYVDSQNSFGAMIRGNFICEYFAVESDTTTLIYIKYNKEELFNIKDTYVNEYKRQKELKDIKQSGNELNQEKLDYIMNKFNNDPINDVSKITNVEFNNDNSIVNIEINAKTKIGDNYWIDFNICSIIDYIKEFNIVGAIKIRLTDKDKTVEVSFDNKFIIEKWKDNKQINLVKEIFGENYKQL